MRRLLLSSAFVILVACESAPSTGEETELGTGSGSTAGSSTRGEPETESADSTGGTTEVSPGTGTGSTTTGDPAVSPSPGCGGDPSGFPQTLEIEGTERTFILALPGDYDPERPYPLVFAWHALGTSSTIARSYYQVEEESAGAAIFLYPDGLPVATLGDQTGWNLDPDGYDLALFDALYEQAIANLCVDELRVFSTGHSFGGFMSNTVGCFRGSRFRAIAPVAGGGPLGTGCEGPVAAWIAHGTVDGTVPFAMGEGSHDHWVGANGCGLETRAVDPSPCVTHQGCDEGYPVVWCAHDEAMPLGGHHWPTWAAPAIWSFFAGF